MKCTANNNNNNCDVGLNDVQILNTANTHFSHGNREYRKMESLKIL